MTACSSAIRSSIRVVSFAALAFAGLTAFAGCQGPPEDDATDSESTEEALIRPGQRCGDTVCGRGEVCCNASCGICTPPGGFCTQQFCGPVADDTDDTDDTTAGECETDSDCRAVANYCGGCNCLAMSATDKEPVCKRAQVRCFAYPCSRQQAYCEQGTCRLGPIGSTVR